MLPPYFFINRIAFFMTGALLRRRAERLRGRGEPRKFWAPPGQTALMA